MTLDSYEVILRDLLDAAEDGRDLAPAELLARHAGHEATARRVLEAYANYERLKAELPAGGELAFGRLDAGSRLGDFVIESPLARGGMGLVYLARQLSLGERRVALKVLPIESASSRGIERFQREALTLAGLHHPNLAEVHGFGEQGGWLFFAMRLVEGPTLRNVLEHRAQRRSEGGTDNQRVRPALVRRVAEVADALAAVHAANLVHRDVKPSNIVLEGASGAGHDWESPAVLVDFGVVRSLDARAATLTGGSPATPSYAPPEQLLGQDVDARADVFSLGVTLHDLLAARRPHERMQASAGLEPIRELVPAIDEDLAAVIAKAADPEMRWRYRDARALRDDLRAWLEGRAVSAREIGAIEAAGRSLRRHPQRVALGALAILAIGALTPVARNGWQNIDASGAARAAFETGQILPMASALRKVDPWLEFLLGSEELIRRRRELASPRADAPWIRVLERLEARDFVGALARIAAEFEARGARNDVLLDRFVLAVLNGEHLGEFRPVAIQLVARAFAHRADANPQEVSSSGGFRSAIRSLLERSSRGSLEPPLQRIERLNLLTALSGCGTPAEIPLVVEMMDATDAPQEEQRLAAFSMERILRRSIPCGLDLELARSSLREVLAPLCSRHTSQRTWPVSRTHQRARVGMFDALVAWALAERAAGNAAPLDALPQGLPPEVSVPVLRDEGLWEALAAFRHPILRTVLTQPDLFTATPEQTTVWGRLCSAFGDESITSISRQTCIALDERCEPGAAFSAASFDRGYAEFADRKAGNRPSHEFSMPRENELFEGELGEALPSGLIAKYTDSSTLALWEFRSTFAYSWGCAQTARGMRLVRPLGSYYLALLPELDSSLELCFRLPDGECFEDVELVLYLQKSSRDILPFSGIADLQIALDAIPSTTVPVVKTEPFEVRVLLASFLLQPGRHLLRLSVTPTSNTSIRLLSARLERGSSIEDSSRGIWYRWPSSFLGLILQRIDGQ